MALLLACSLMMSPAPGELDDAQRLAQPERVTVVAVEREQPEPEQVEPPPNLEIPAFELDEQDLRWSRPSKDFSNWDAMPSINLGLGLVWHPGSARKVGFNSELLFGAVLWNIPVSLWPELGVNVGTARDRGQITGVAQLGLGLGAILYYHVGFEGGLSVDGLAYGPRHGPSLRTLQFFGIELRHKVFFAHAEPGVVRHDLTLNFSIDFGAFIGVMTGDWVLW